MNQDCPFPDFFNEVRKSLLQDTNALQIPWENSSALDSIYLAEPVHAEWRIDEVDDLLWEFERFPLPSSREN